MGLLPTKGLTLPLMSFGGSDSHQLRGARGAVAIDWENRRLMRGAKMKTLLVMAGVPAGTSFLVWLSPTCSGPRLASRLDGRAGQPGSQTGSAAGATKWPGYVLPHCVARGLLRKLLLPFHLLAACWQARRKSAGPTRRRGSLRNGWLRQLPRRFDGGSARLSLIIHEQNSIAGLTNRVLARFAERVACGFPDALPALTTGSAIPLRPEISALPRPMTPRRPPRPAGWYSVAVRVPAALNDTSFPRARRWSSSAARPLVIRAGEASPSARTMSTPGYRPTVLPSSKTWPAPTVGRSRHLPRRRTVAGGGGVALASLLVPFPHAVDDHQTRNAGFLAGPVPRPCFRREG